MKDIKRICITGTAYNLFFNLLLTPDEELDSVYYFTCESVPASIRGNLKQQTCVHDMFKMSMLKKLKFICRYQIFSKLFCKYLDTCDIYAQDHLPYMPYVIGRRKYIYTEDAPGILKVSIKQKYVNDGWQHNDNLNGFKKAFVEAFDVIHGGILGRSTYCKKMIVSDDSCPNYCDGENFVKADLSELWNTSSTLKQEYIFNVFNIEASDINELKKRKTILFTQPFFEDGNLPTIEEHVALYRSILSRYDLSDVVIKKHPREHIDYLKYFPEAFVFNKPVPFQLLTVAGVKFDNAVTICSTAALGIPYPIKIDWVGAAIHPLLLKDYGDFRPSCN